MSVLANKFLDKMIDKLELKNDAALSRAMHVSPPVLSKLRHDRLPFGATMIIKAHKLTGWTVTEIEKSVGVKIEVGAGF